MKRNFISILLPVYNAIPYLQICLDSIQNQTEENWELIAIDDFSTDHSLQILMDFKEKNPTRVKVFQNQKKGIIPALQLAFQKSQGEYITRMDADDLMEKTKLETLKGILQKNGKRHLATGLVKYFSETTLGEGYQKYEQWLNHPLPCLDVPSR